MCLKKILFLICFISILSIISFHKSIAQETGKLDPVYIAKEYYNSIVKILLFDSVAEKKVPGSGYIGRGSGFIVTEDGVVFTNEHVIDFCMEYMKYKYFSPSDKKYYDEISNFNSSSLLDPEYFSIDYVRRAIPIIQVYLDKNGSSYKLYYAKVISYDSDNFDGAILQIVSDLKGNPVNEKFHPVPIGNSDETNQGEDLCLYGFPAQYDESSFDVNLRDPSTLTSGKHSGFDYYYKPLYGFIKTDASVNSGNSGGPVFNTTNKVIGIATATGNKTNIGFIGGINPMYNLASLQRNFLEQYEKTDITKAAIGIHTDKLKKGKLTKLVDQLSEKGLIAPKQIAAKNTAILFSKQKLPSLKEIEKSNKAKKVVRKFQGNKSYFKVSYIVLNNGKYSISDNSDLINDGIILNPNKTFEVKFNNEIGMEFGHLKALARISENSKISLLFSMFTSYGVMDWSNVNIYSDTMSSQFTYLKNAKTIKFGESLGLNYSYIFLNRIPVDFYYKFTGCIEDAKIGEFENTGIEYTFNGRGKDIEYEAFPLFHTLGININFDFCFIGLEYSFGKGKINYMLPYIDYGINGNTVYYVNTDRVTGEEHISNLKLSLGLNFGGGNKWKKLAIKKYKESQ